MRRLDTLLGITALAGRGRLLAGLVAAAALTASAATIALADAPPRHAEVDGKGARDDLVTFTERSQPDGQGAAEVSGWDLHVRLETGRVLSAFIGNVNQPSFKKVGNVDGRPGDELFVTSPATGATLLDVFTYYRGALVHEQPQFSSRCYDIIACDGVVCRSHHGRHFITQRSWRMDETFVNHQPVDTWRRQDTVYVWKKGHLHKFTTSKWKQVPGQPPPSQTGIACAHNATS